MDLVKTFHFKNCSFYTIRDWYEIVPIEARRHLRPDIHLRFIDISLGHQYRRGIHPSSTKILSITIERLFFIDSLLYIEDILSYCYNNQITIVIDASIDDMNYVDSKHINNCFDKLKDYLNENYFKLLVSVPLSSKRFYLSPHWKKYAIYMNYWAYNTAYNLNQWGNPEHYKNKKYYFSIFAGRILRDGRLYFMTECHREKLFDKTFFKSSEPFLLDIVNILSNDMEKFKYSDNEYDNQVFELNKRFLKCLKVNVDIPPIEVYNQIFKNNNFLPLPLLHEWSEESKNHLYKNINDILFNHNFIDDEGNPTTLNKIEKDLNKVKNKTQIMHWDKLIPTQMNDSWINIVPEGDVPYFSEKTYKPIFAGVAFTQISNAHFEFMFKELGFEPYYNLFNYDVKDISLINQINIVVDQLKLLKKEKHFDKLMKDQIPIIKYNQNHLKNITQKFDYLKEI